MQSIGEVIRLKERKKVTKKERKLYIDDCSIYRELLTDKVKIYKSKNGKNYVRLEDYPILTAWIAPRFHGKFAKMLLEDGEAVLIWANYCRTADGIKNRRAYFLRGVGKKMWSRTLKFIRKLKRLARLLPQLKEKFQNQPDWWYRWVGMKASDFIIEKASGGKHPPRLLSYLLARVS